MRLLSVFKSGGLLLALTGLPFSFLSAASDDVLNNISNHVRNVFHQRHAAIVRVEATDSHGRLMGTGFYIDPSGTLYTLAAIVSGAKEVTVFQGDQKLPAKVLTSDTRSGIALLKVNATTPFLPLGDSHSLEVATPVISIGYPMDLPASPHFGLVAGLDQKCMGCYFSTTHVRANIPVQRGEGGSPILNLDGQVVGILVSGIDNGSACYFLPIAAAEKIRSDQARFGKVRHGWIGARVAEANLPVEGFSAQIVELDDASPAEEAGLQKGDIVTRIGSIDVKTPEDILDASFFLSAGDATPVKILRNGELQTLTIRPIDHPYSEAPDMQTNFKMHINIPNKEPFRFER